MRLEVLREQVTKWAKEWNIEVLQQWSTVELKYSNIAVLKY